MFAISGILIFLLGLHSCTNTTITYISQQCPSIAGAPFVICASVQSHLVSLHVSLSHRHSHTSEGLLIDELRARVTTYPCTSPRTNSENAPWQQRCAYPSSLLSSFSPSHHGLLHHRQSSASSPTTWPGHRQLSRCHTGSRRWMRR